MGIVRSSEHSRRQLGLDECFVEASVRGLRNQATEKAKRCPIIVRGRGNVIAQTNGTDRSDAPQGDDPFAILGRFFGVGCVESTCRFRNGTEILLHDCQRFRLFKLTRHNEDDIVGLIVLGVKVLKFFDGYSFDVGTISDRRFSIVMPFISGRIDPLVQN